MDEDPAVRDIAAAPSPGGSTTGNAPDPGLSDPTETTVPFTAGRGLSTVSQASGTPFRLSPVSVFQCNHYIRLSYSLFRSQFSLLLLPIPPLSVFLNHFAYLRYVPRNI